MERFQAVVKKKKDFTICIGTNETIEYADGEELLEELEASALTLEEERIILKFFGSAGGFTDFLSANAEDDDDDFDDDHDELDWNVEETQF